MKNWKHCVLYYKELISLIYKELLEIEKKMVKSFMNRLFIGKKTHTQTTLICIMWKEAQFYSQYETKPWNCTEISHLSNWQKPKNWTAHSLGKMVGKWARSCIAGGSAKWYNPCRGQFGMPYQNYKCIYPLTQQSHFWEFILLIHLTDTKQWIYINMQGSTN